MNRYACFALIAVSLALTASAPAQSKWDGTWKFDEAKSRLTGFTLTITEVGGKYVLEQGGLKTTFACDGKDYPSLADRMISCTRAGNTFDLTVKYQGKTLATNHNVVSADGQRLQMNSVNYRPDGSTATVETKYVREGPGKGITGTWKDTKTSINAASSIVIRQNGDTLHQEWPEYKGVAEMKLDGTPAQVTGPNVPPGVTYAARIDGNTLKETAALNGKAVGEAVFTIAPDGKSMTEVSWSPAKPAEKQTVVYDRQ